MTQTKNQTRATHKTQLKTIEPPTAKCKFPVAALAVGLGMLGLAAIPKPAITERKQSWFQQHDTELGTFITDNLPSGWTAILSEHKGAPGDSNLDNLDCTTLRLSISVNKKLVFSDPIAILIPVERPANVAPVKRAVIDIINQLKNELSNGFSNETTIS